VRERERERDGRAHGRARGRAVRDHPVARICPDACMHTLTRKLCACLRICVRVYTYECRMEMTLNVVHLHMYGPVCVVCCFAHTFVVYGLCAWVSLRVGMCLWAMTCTRTHLWAMTCDIIFSKLTLCARALGSLSLCSTRGWILVFRDSPATRLTCIIVAKLIAAANCRAIHFVRI
jgi:hypothetical protein